MRPFLRNKSHLVVARAAARAATSQPPCAQDLIDAFRRLIEDPGKRDPGCTAKVAIAKSLSQADEPAAEVYFAGVRHVQMEPVWGGQEDTARDLRGICAIGLVRMSHPEALLEAVRLLSDPTSEARIGAIRALSESGRPEAELVLRFKAMQGDRNNDVTGECFAGLLRLGPRERSLPYVADFLNRRDTEVAEAAAIALGESRLHEAWPLLREAYAQPGLQPAQGAILWGIAMLRLDEGVDFLLERVSQDREAAGAAAIEALAPYRGDPSIRDRLERVVLARKSPVLEKAMRTYWETG
jgi:HEAT repeat protein